MNDRVRAILSRFAALALLFGVAVLAVLAVAAPVVREMQAARADLQQQRELLGRFQAFSGSDAIGQPAKRMPDAAQQALFLPGETDALRMAALQSIITEIAARHGTRLATTRELPAEETGGVRLIGVQAEFTTDMAGLQAISLAIQSHRPILFVRALQVSPSGTWRSTDGRLRLRLDLYAAAHAPVDGKS